MHKNNIGVDVLIRKISYYPKKRISIFKDLPPHIQAELILRTSRKIQKDLINSLKKEELVIILSHLDTDEATDILQLLPDKLSLEIISQLNDNLKTGINFLMQFDPASAAGLMNIDYIQVREDENIAAVSKQVRIHEKRTGKLPTILVLKNGRLSGYLPGHHFGFADPREKVENYVKKIHFVKHSANIQEVTEVFRHYPHNKIVVIGNTGNVMGVIYSDDILKAIREKKAASLYDFAGVSQEESVYDTTKQKINYRYKWLIINLGTAFLAAFTVGLFDEVISKYVLLAVYMPIVAGMGGNAATQTLAVMVRAISLKQIELKTMWKTLYRELGSGFFNGLINGVIITLVVYLKDGDLRIGIILALAMIINLLIAAFFGTSVPLIMKKLGKDPASSATIFITTATDIFGFLAFLGLATMILS